MTTVRQSTSFQRPVVDTDVLITARTTKLGRSLAFIDVTMAAENAPGPAAHATLVYALMS